VLDVVGQLIHAAATKNCQVFSSVPWVLEKILGKWTAASSEQRLAIEEALRALKTYYVGGARASASCISWVKEIALLVVFGIGMTETGGPMFQSLSDSTVGWPKSDCMISDAELFLIKECENSETSGELAIKSAFNCKGYIQGDNSAFSVEDGKLVFRTGDIYEETEDNYLIWKGRKTDFV